jgi:hypothetical protein
MTNHPWKSGQPFGLSVFYEVSNPGAIWLDAVIGEGIRRRESEIDASLADRRSRSRTGLRLRKTDVAAYHHKSWETRTFSLSLALDYLAQVSGKARKMYNCDSSTGSSILRPPRVGGNLTLRLHNPNLARRPGGSAFFAVIAFPRRKLRDPVNS